MNSFASFHHLNITKESIMNDTTVAPTEPVYLLHKTASCPSVSAKSTITYRIEVNEHADIFFRLVANTAAGRFNDDAIAYLGIRRILQQHSVEGISSSTLATLYEMKSTNSKSFLLAALLNEGLVQVMPNKEHRYEVLDDTGWLAHIQTMQDTQEVEISPSLAAMPKKLTLKASTKKG